MLFSALCLRSIVENSCGGVRCDSNAECLSSDDGQSCVCMSGWSGDGQTCFG